MAKPLGRATRGTTGVNRLRRVDRWIASLPALRSESPLIVDLGFGASATTTLELHERLHDVNPSVSVIGFEIDPERVACAQSELEEARTAGRARHGRAVATDVLGTGASEADDPVRFALGGFEIPSERPATVIRAMNVLRQYEEHEVSAIWEQLRSRLAAGGAIVEGTSNEIGRVASWITLSSEGPETVTFALKVDELGTEAMPAPSVLAERLPKALIHRNVPGEPIHRALMDLDRAWASAAPLGAFSAAQRWAGTVAGMRDLGWPVLHERVRTRFGEMTLPWSAVVPLP